MKHFFVGLFALASVVPASATLTTSCRVTYHFAPERNSTTCGGNGDAHAEYGSLYAQGWGNYAYGDPDRDYSGYGSASFEQTATFTGRPGQGYLVVYARTHVHWNGEVSLNIPATPHFSLVLHEDEMEPGDLPRFHPIQFGEPVTIAGSVWAGTSGGPDGSAAMAIAQLDICALRVIAEDKSTVLGEWGGYCEASSHLTGLQRTADATYALAELPQSSPEIPEPATLVTSAATLLAIELRRRSRA